MLCELRKIYPCLAFIRINIHQRKLFISFFSNNIGVIMGGTSQPIDEGTAADLKGMHAQTRKKDDLIGEELIILSYEPRTIKLNELTERKTYLFTARAVNKSDEIIQFWGSAIMDDQIDKGYIKTNDTVTIDKTMSHIGRFYFAFVKVGGEQGRVS